jgi:hypothetical protein
MQHQPHQPRFYHLIDLYAIYYTLSIPAELHTQQLLTLWCIKHGMICSELPDVSFGYFTLNRSLHDHETRLLTYVHICKANTTFGQRSVTYIKVVFSGTTSHLISQQLIERHRLNYH